MAVAVIVPAAWAVHMRRWGGGDGDGDGLAVGGRCGGVAVAVVVVVVRAVVVRSMAGAFFVESGSLSGIPRWVHSLTARDHVRSPPDI